MKKALLVSLFFSLTYYGSIHLFSILIINLSIGEALTFSTHWKSSLLFSLLISLTSF